MHGITDPDMPGLSTIGPEGLRAITGHPTELLRLRYRAGNRAVLHVLERPEGIGPPREGALWFFKGDKSRRIANRSPGAVYDPGSGALLERFPQDHRLPEIGAFLAGFDEIAPKLLGQRPAGLPEPLRYRPGLSCTFRCPLVSGGAAFVKIVADDDVWRLQAFNAGMRRALPKGPLGIVRVLGIDGGLRAIAYAAAGGRPLDAVLADGNDPNAVDRALDALAGFWRLDLRTRRRFDLDALIARAADAAEMVRVTAPPAYPRARAILDRLTGRRPSITHCPIHGDMKLEHVFVSDTGITLIDTESVAMGPPDYDLAQLYGRLWQAALDGTLAAETVERAAATVRDVAGPTFDWCLGVVALRLAKFHAQRPGPGAAERAVAILDCLS